ncbi:MAG TPA: hypothetical protein VFG35_08670 [Actinoplanes sp.]|nr:hypothetical protein [Actinoplanes sp.]
MRRCIAFLAVLATALTGTLLWAPGAQAATGPSSTRVVTADRAAAGEQVVVTLSATCPAGATIKVIVTVTAANDTRIAQGTRQKMADCTGAAQPIELRVQRDPIGALFRVGEATANTVRTVCDETDCETIPFDETIRIS